VDLRGNLRHGAVRRDMVALFGHYAEGTGRVDGQIQRTRIVIEEFRARLGSDRVTAVDTGQLAARPSSTWWAVRNAAAACDDLVMMPGARGLRWLFPEYLRWQRRRGYRIHYLAVGGWLPRFLRERPQYCDRLQACAGIYVQTQRMVRELSALGVSNVHLLPNFRYFPPERPISGERAGVLRAVFFSRLLREKGPEMAVNAVQMINQALGDAAVQLDLWGPVQRGQERWFSELTKSEGPNIRFCGHLEPDRIGTTLAEYDVMLFPTWYSGEGFPGVIVDAFIAGIPIIASDWQDNPELIRHKEDGLLFRSKDVDDLIAKIEWALERPDDLARMKKAAAARAKQYHVDEIIPPLLRQMGLM
jgi:glycosyltransferase involved in cell wall biosynthesis